MKRNQRAATNQQRGFTIMQMVVTVALIAIVTAFGVIGIKNARAEFRLQNAARLFASYVEKARADSIRRHATGSEESSVETFGEGTTQYVVTMDWGSGTVESRTFQLDPGLDMGVVAKKVTFDWRGRIAEAWVFQIRCQQLGKNYPVDVSGSGDITVGEQHFPDQLIAAIDLSTVGGDVATPTPTPVASPPNPDATPTPTPTPIPTPTPTPSNGNGNGGDNGNGGSGNGNGNGNSSPTPTPTPTPTPNPSATPTPTPTPMPQCLMTVSPSSLSLSQSDSAKLTGTATISVVNGFGVRTLSAAQAGNGNSLVIALSLTRIDGNGNSVISITTKHGAGNRGVFNVEVSASPSCGSTQTLQVSVSN
jgi:Tfp pilus assembly protein PilE